MRRRVWMALMAIALTAVFLLPGRSIDSAPRDTLEKVQREVEGANAHWRDEVRQLKPVRAGNVTITIAFSDGKETWVPLRATAERLGHKVAWNAQARVVMIDGRAVPTQGVMSRAYVTAGLLTGLLGRRVVDTPAAVDIEAPATRELAGPAEPIGIHAGRHLVAIGLRAGGTDYGPLLLLDQGLELRVRWQTGSAEAFVRGTAVPVWVHDHVLYARLRDLAPLVDGPLSAAATLSAPTGPGYVVWKANVKGKRIALTFDDYLPGNAGDIARLVSRAHGRATFFLVSESIPGNEDALRDLVDKGMEIGSHTTNHFNAHTLGSEEMRAEIAGSTAAIERVTGRPVTLWRPPGGFYTGASLGLASSTGLTTVLWSLNSNDANPSVTPEQMVRNVGDGAVPGAIIALHLDNKNTLRALPQILKLLHRRGFSLVTVSELLGQE